MPQIRNLLIGMLLLCFCSCKKQKTPKDIFVQGDEHITALNLTASSAGKNFIEVAWDKVYSDHFEDIVYTVYLNEQKIAENLTATKYTFVGLSQGKEFNIKVVAITNGVKKIEQVIKGSTTVNTVEHNVFYKEYKIHKYSQLLSPTKVLQLQDGGHLVVNELYVNNIYFVVVFRTNKQGDMQWYRILPNGGFSGSIGGPFNIVVHEQNKGMVLFGKSIFDLSLENGELLKSKALESLGNTSIRAIIRIDDNTIIGGTGDGKIFSLNTQTLALNWLPQKTDRNCIAIQKDSKNNLFVLCGENNLLTLLKYDDKGLLLKRNEFNIPSVVASLVMDNDDNLFIVSRISSDSPISLLKTNNNGELIGSAKLYDPFEQPCALLGLNNEIIIYGDLAGPGLKVNGAVYRMDRNLKIKSRKIYGESFDNRLGGVTQNQDGSLNLFLNYIDYYDFTNMKLLFIKTDANGDI